jgi:hypothetical protein
VDDAYNTRLEMIARDVPEVEILDCRFEIDEVSVSRS